MSGTFTILFDFNGTTGSSPTAGVTDVNGLLYGTTTSGGTNQAGTLFSFNPANSQIQTLVDPGASSGTSLTDVNGILYGTAYNGGTNVAGSIYSYDIATGQTVTLVNFNVTDGNGYNPNTSLTDVNGTLFGTTAAGGTGSAGTLYSYTIATGQTSTLINFDVANGTMPDGSVTDINGTLYGTTFYGGTSSRNGEAGYGTLYSYSIATGQTNTLVNFSFSMGADPAGSLTDVNGTLYGTTQAGGTGTGGTVFSYNPITGQFATLVDFVTNGLTGASPDGASPDPGVTDINGTLYGTTSQGGASGDGTLYSYTIATGQFQNLLSFDGTNGNPYASLTDVNGTLYGTTEFGGTSGDGVLFSYTPPCFAAGTRILTLHGEIPVEHLQPGTAVILADGAIAPIVWIGRRTLDVKNHQNPEKILPILIAAGALDHGIPSHDLLLSPDHALFLQDHLIPAKALINGATIRQVARRSVTYYHVELPDHAVLIAEATPCESYLETGNRDAFANGGKAVRLHPTFGPTPNQQSIREAQGCAPFAESGPAVEAARTEILSRAGIATTRDPAVSIVRRPDGAAIIISRSAVPGHLTPDPRDRRQLGVKIAAIIRDDGSSISLDHPLLTEGWHDLEPDGRWTDGRAVIPAALTAGTLPHLTITATLNYPTPPDAVSLRSGKRRGRA